MAPWTAWKQPGPSGIFSILDPRHPKKYKLDQRKSDVLITSFRKMDVKGVFIIVFSFTVLYEPIFGATVDDEIKRDVIFFIIIV